jgi:hypothetical protein
MRPPVVSTGPFPWSLQQPSPSSVAVFPQDLGFLQHGGMAAAARCVPCFRGAFAVTRSQLLP